MFFKFMRVHTVGINSGFYLRLLRFPLVTIVILSFLLYFVNASGVIFMVTAAKGKFQSLLFGILTIGNMLLVYVTFANFIELRTTRELATQGMGRELGIGLILGFSLIASCVLIAMALGVYRIDGFNDWRNLLPSGVALSLPFFEEMVFRGVIFRKLEKKIGSWTALIISSLIFGCVHLPNGGESIFGIASIVFVYGPMLTVPFMITRRLWLGIGLHGSWNYTIGKIFSISVSGVETQGLLKVSSKGPEWLTGGSSGLEGSLICVLIGMTATLLMLKLASRNGNIVPLQKKYWNKKRFH